MSDTKFILTWALIGLCIGLFWGGLLALFGHPYAAIAMVLACTAGGPWAGGMCKSASLQDQGRG